MFHKSELYPKLKFYEKVLTLNKYDNIYLSSVDENIIFDNDTKKFDELKKIYNIKIFKENEANTILFASTCKYICLSSGTFSLVIGLFSYFSKSIYYSVDAGKYYNNKKNMIDYWHPEFYKILNKVHDKFIEINF